MYVHNVEQKDVQLGYTQGVYQRFPIQKLIRYIVNRVHCTYSVHCTGQGRSILLYEQDIPK